MIENRRTLSSYIDQCLITVIKGLGKFLRDSEKDWFLAPAPDRSFRHQVDLYLALSQLSG